MEQEKLLTAPPETTVSDAAKLMAERKVGAIMVVDERGLVGIFTERDAVFRVIARDLDSQTIRLIDVRTAGPVTPRGASSRTRTATGAWSPRLRRWSP